MAKLSLRRIVHTFEELGPQAFFASAWRKLGGISRRGRHAIQEQIWANKARETENSTHPFDERYGTDTSGIISGEGLLTGSRNDLWNTAYYGISPSVLNQTCAALDLDWPRFTFIDLGSGKGRALLLSSRYPWRAILGVELSPDLNEIARANIQKFSAPWQLCHAIEAIPGDAALFPYPPGPLVVFLYHPFLAPVLKRCLKNLAQSLAEHPRETYIVYVNPILEAHLKCMPKMTKLWERTFSYTEEDTQADQLGGSGDRVSVWHFHP